MSDPDPKTLPSPSGTVGSFLAPLVLGFLLLTVGEKVARLILQIYDPSISEINPADQKWVREIALLLILLFAATQIALYRHRVKLQNMTHEDALAGLLGTILAAAAYVFWDQEAFVVIDWQVAYWIGFAAILVIVPAVWLLMPYARNSVEKISLIWRLAAFVFPGVLIGLVAGMIWQAVVESRFILGSYVPPSAQCKSNVDATWWLARPGALVAIGSVLPLLVFAPRFATSITIPKTRVKPWILIYSSVLVLWSALYGLDYLKDGFGFELITKYSVPAFSFYAMFGMYALAPVLGYGTSIKLTESTTRSRIIVNVLTIAVFMALVGIIPSLIYHHIGCGDLLHWSIPGLQAITGALIGILVSFYERRLSF